MSSIRSISPATYFNFELTRGTDYERSLAVTKIKRNFSSIENLSYTLKRDEIFIMSAFYHHATLRKTTDEASGLVAEKILYQDPILSQTFKRGIFHRISRLHQTGFDNEFTYFKLISQGVQNLRVVPNAFKQDAIFVCTAIEFFAEQTLNWGFNTFSDDPILKTTLQNEIERRKPIESPLAPYNV